MNTNYTRRRTLELSAGALVTAVGGGCLGLGHRTTTIELRAEKEGWVGKTPLSIRGRTNPTLPLKTGKTYELIWHNRDGTKHEFALLDKDGKAVHTSQSTKKRGAHRTLAFEAEPKLVAYHDHYHPETMHGTVKVGSAGIGAASTNGTTE